MKASLVLAVLAAAPALGTVHYGITIKQRKSQVQTTMFILHFKTSIREKLAKFYFY